MKHKCDGCKYKSTHQEMGFAPFGVCTKERNLAEAEKSYNAEICPYKRTNFERIKTKISNMDIEELIDFCGGESCVNILCKFIHDERCHCREHKVYNCGDCIREYLESEII